MNAKLTPSHPKAHRHPCSRPEPAICRGTCQALGGWRGLTLATILTLLSSPAATAANQYYSAASNTVWDTVTPDWSTTSGGTYTGLWGAGNTAVFEGTAGSVTVGTGGNPTCGGIVFSNTGYTLSGGTIAILSGSAIKIATPGQSATLNSVITDASGACNVSFAGGNYSSSLTLGGTNTFSGTATITACVVNFNRLATGGNPSSFGQGASSVAVTVGGNSSACTANYTGSGGTTDRPWLVGGSAAGSAPAINNNGSGAISFGYTGGAIATASSVGNRNLTLGGSYAASANTFAGQLTNMTGYTTTLTIDGSIWQVTGTNTYGGLTTVNGNGVLIANSLNYISSGSLSPNGSSSLGHPTTTVNGAIQLGGGGGAGTLVYSGTGETSDRVINLAGTTGGATLDQSGTGLLEFTSAFTATGAGSKTLTLQGSSSGTGEIAGAIVDNGGVNLTSLSKAGSGTWILSGVNTYSGATTINAGTLALGSHASIADSASLSLAAGATLDVSAMPTFALSAPQALIASGNTLPATIKGAPGGTIDLGSQPIALNYDGSHPALTIAQGTLVLAGNTVTVNGMALQNGTYVLAQQASGSISSNGVLSVTGSAVAGGNASLSVTGGNLLLTVTAAPTWSAAVGTLAYTTNHYKVIKALQWNYGTNDVLTVTNPGISPGAVTDYYSNTCSLWVYNPSPLTNQSLVFQFIDASGTTQYSFTFYLNYSGWREVQRSFLYDPMGGAHASANFAKVAIVGPTNLTGQLYFDGITWAGARFTRYKDCQNLDITGLNSATNFYHCFYELPPDIATNPPTTNELSDLATARMAWLADNAGNNPSSGTLAGAWQTWSNLNIVVTGSNIVSTPISQTGIWLFEPWVITLGQSIYWSSNATSSNLLNQLIRDLWDQGFDYNSNFDPYDQNNGGHFDYNFRQTPLAFILAYQSYTPDFKQHVWQMLNWYFRQGHYWTQTYAPGLTAGGQDDKVLTDDIYTQINQELGAILFLTPDDPTAIQYLRGFQRYLERFLAPTDGTDDGLKPDGCGFHHEGHYNHYMYAFPTVADTLFDLNNTEFQVNSNAYLNLRLAHLAMIWQGNSPNLAAPTQAGCGPNSLSGRYPFQNTDINIAYTDLQRLGAVGTDVLGQPDPLLAQVYNRVFGSTYPYAPFNAYGTETNVGFYQFNWSPVAVYAQSNWVACLHGMNSNFWGSEIQTGCNLYGRYQSYGACEIVYPGGDAASGWGLTGWDWNKPPGTTTILLPWTQLYEDEPLTYEIHDDTSKLNFAGGLAFHGNGIYQGGNGGLYACNYQVYTNSAMTNHNGSFVWRKSWFCFTNQIICLGSNITNNDAVDPTITTLFQGLLPNPGTPTVVNGTAITSFPYVQTNSLTSANWLLDGYGTGYFVRPGVNLVLSRTLQSSPDQAGSGAFSSTNYATAWIDHGMAPAGAAYEYVVVPATTAAAMAQLATAYTNPATSPYAVLECDATAHVVQWIPDGRIGYALFATNALASAVTNTGPIRSVSLPCLAMTQPTNGELWLTVVNPDLNLVSNVSQPATLLVTLAGTWSLASGSTNASVIAGTTNATTLQIQTFDGFPVEVLLAVPPNPPQGLTATVLATNQIYLTWQTVANATGYIVLQNGTEIATVAGTNYSDLGLAAGTAYAFSVQATNGGGISPASTTVTVTTPITGAWFQWDANPGAPGAQDGSGIWGTAAVNWLYAANNVGWFDHSWASFGTNTATNCVVTLTNDVTPTGITFNPTLGTYTVTGNNIIWTTDGLNLVVSSNAVISAPISGPGGLTNTGMGSLTISGTNSYTGLTTVNAGVVNVLGNQSAAYGGWTLTSGVSWIGETVNFNSGSMIVIASTNGVYLKNTMSSGLVNAALNVSGTVTNNGAFNVSRLGVMTLNSGANWTQGGSMLLGPGNNTSATAALIISNGATFAYAGSGPIGLSPASGNSGPAKLTLLGGEFITAQGFQNSTATGTGTATIILTNGGTLALSADVPQLTSGVATNTFLSTGSGDFGGAIDTSVFSTTISNVITGSGNLTKLGAGTLTLSASNTFTGATTISNGVLLVNGFLGTGPVLVASAGTLGGNGTIGGPVTLNGMVAPGSAAVGTLTTAGETWNGGGVYQFSLNNATNSSGCDALIISGALNLQSAMNNPFSINLVSLTSSNTPGPLAGFSSAGTNIWTLATVSAGIQNFNPAAFAVNTSGFSNLFTGTFTVGTNAGALLLTYTGLPLVAPSVGNVTHAAGTFGFSFSGPAGQGYHLFASTNLALPWTNWTMLTNNIFGTGVVNYLDVTTNQPQRFFRVGSP